VKNKIETRQCYLRLIEKNATSGEITTEIDASIWGSSYNNIFKFEKETGQSFQSNIQILVQVKIVYHEKYGLKLDILDIDSSFTLGNLELAKTNTLKKLVAENPDKIKFVNGAYVTYNNSLSFGLVIQKIALIASIGTDGHNDFIKQLVNNQRAYKFHIDPYDTQVQGKGAEILIKQRLLQVFQSNKIYDAVVIVRGGGSQVDFHTFNDYQLCRTVARFPLPIITGIGHERNEAIIDLMAKQKTNAPTQAATFILHHNRKFEESVLDLQQTIFFKSQQTLAKYSNKISGLNTSIVNKARNILNRNKDALTKFTQIAVNKPQAIIYARKSKLHELSNLIINKPTVIIATKLNNFKNIVSNIQINSFKFLKNQEGSLKHFDSLFKMLDFSSILKKGFAVIYHKGKIVSGSTSIKNNDELIIRLLNSEINVIVESKSEIDGTKPIL